MKRAMRSVSCGGGGRDLLVELITLPNDQSSSPPAFVPYLSPYFMLNRAGDCSLTCSSVAAPGPGWLSRRQAAFCLP